MKKPFWGALKQYSKCYDIICHFKLHSLHVCQIVIISYLFLCIWNPKLFSQQVGSLELFFIASLQAIPFQLSSVSLTTSLYQVRMILILLGTVTAEGGMLALKLSSISKTKRVVFFIPLWHPLSWILSLSKPMDLPRLSYPYLLWRIENPHKQAKTLSTVWLAVTVLLVCVFILLWVVLSLSLYDF